MPVLTMNTARPRERERDSIRADIAEWDGSGYIPFLKDRLFAYYELQRANS